MLNTVEYERAQNRAQGVENHMVYVGYPLYRQYPLQKLYAGRKRRAKYKGFQNRLADAVKPRIRRIKEPERDEQQNVEKRVKNILEKML